jgi:hypothetical protein
MKENDVEERIREEVRDFEVKQKSILALRAAGIPLPKEPPYIGDEVKMPHDITIISYQDLGKLHGNLVTMACYARTLAALADIEKESAEQMLGYVKDRKILLKADPEEKVVVYAKARATVDSLVRHYTQRYLQANAKHTLIDSQVENMERCAEAASREITRRISEIEKTMGGE